jgi:hypothetical protein
MRRTLHGTKVGCAAKARGEIHAGWNASVPRDLLKVANMDAIEPVLKKWWNGRPGATQDINL